MKVIIKLIETLVSFIIVTTVVAVLVNIPFSGLDLSNPAPIGLCVGVIVGYFVARGVYKGK